MRYAAITPERRPLLRAPASLLLPLLVIALLPVAAHADPMDQFSIIGGGLDIEFALPASTTGPDDLFSPGYGFGSVPGTVNGEAADISPQFIFPGPCAVCDTIELFTGSETLFIGLPPLYELTFPTMNTVTLTFLPGPYTAGTEYPHGGPTYAINITPEATATTPEPPSLWLVATAAFAALGLRRRLVLH